MKVSGLKVAGFVKVRNEILREGNLYRLLDQLEVLCDHGVICDDGSTDGTREALQAWCATRLEWFLWSSLDEPNFLRELRMKQVMLDWLHTFQHPNSRGWTTDWILWMDGDELFDKAGLAGFRPWLEVQQHTDTDIWAFHYTQLWRSASWARIDHGFDYGWFWKLWRYKPELSFEIKDRLHHAQFPAQYVSLAVNAANRGGSAGRAKRAPWDILHFGNYGKNLAWKAIQYRNSGPSERESLQRHLYFPDTATRAIDPNVYPEGVQPHFDKEPPVPFTPHEIQCFERLGDMKKRPGLCVVIVPTFNRGYALDRTLGSVLAQTYENWACVVLDDGSTDDTAQLMRGWQDRDPRFFYCRYPANRGGVAMNEIGMNIAVDWGEVWVRLGSDDYFKPHKLALDMLAFENGAKAVYGPYCDLHNPHNNGTGEWLGPELRNPPSDARGALLSRGFAASWANVAVRTECLRAVRDRHGCYVEPLHGEPRVETDQYIRNMEDWPFNSRLSYLYEWTWRGIVNSEVVIGARSLDELGKLEVHAPEVRRDAVWRIGQDGASQKGKQCALDAREIARVLNEDAAKFKPEPRVLEYNVIRLPWFDR